MRTAAQLLVCGLILALVTPAHPQSTKVEKKTVAFDSLDRHIQADLFDPGFDVGDSNYNAIVAASDGKIHFVINTHKSDYACRYYTFDPSSKKIALVAELDQALGEDAHRQVSQGKVHTPLIEHAGKIWFATHTAFYEQGLPGLDTKGKAPYSGGRFVSYDLATGRFESLARVLPPEGIITMNMDVKNEILYGLTWPSALLVSYDIRTKALRSWGAVQARGEWGHHPWNWDRVCRQLGIDPEGYVYGSTMDGQIWKYDPTPVRRVGFIDGLDLSRVPFTQSAEESMKGDFQNNWRVITWNPRTKSFWGLHFETTTLFEFIPSANYARAVAELRPQAYRGMPRNPETSQLGFILGPKNTLFYLAHGPAVDLPDRPALQSGLYLLTYDITNQRLTDHGPILSADRRRVFFTESIAIGPDDHIYTVAWVELLETKRKPGEGPEETAASAYSIQLVRLPKWQTFSDRRSK